MSKLTTQQMIDTIRKGDRLGHDFLQAVAGRLESLEAENDRLRGALSAFIAAYGNHGERTSIHEWAMKLKAACESAREVPNMEKNS